MGPKTRLPVYTLETAPPRLIFKIGTHNDKKLLGTEANLSRTGKIGKKETDGSDQRERREQARKSQKINYRIFNSFMSISRTNHKYAF